MTGHGLKDTATALESAGDLVDAVIDPDVEQAAAAAGLRDDASSPGRSRVTVPGDRANLGPGFDSLGLALELRDELDGRSVDRTGSAVEVVGRGGRRRSRCDETHLVVRAMRAAFDADGRAAAGLRLTCRNRDPARAVVSGSSSAAIVGGRPPRPRAGRRRAAAGSTDDAAFRLAAEPRGSSRQRGRRPCFGGLDDRRAARATCSTPRRARSTPRIRAVAFVPPTPLVDRAWPAGCCPPTVPHADAAANAGRAALLVAALATGRTAAAPRATRDWLHQEYRRPAMPDSLDLVDAAPRRRARGGRVGRGPDACSCSPTATGVDPRACARARRLGAVVRTSPRTPYDRGSDRRRPPSGGSTRPGAVGRIAGDAAHGEGWCYRGDAPGSRRSSFQDLPHVPTHPFLSIAQPCCRAHHELGSGEQRPSGLRQSAGRH